MLKKASRNNDEGNASANASHAYQWDLAVAWGHGRHITVFTYRRILICVTVMLIIVAIVALIWVF